MARNNPKDKRGRIKWRTVGPGKLGGPCLRQRVARHDATPTLSVGTICACAPDVISTSTHPSMRLVARSGRGSINRCSCQRKSRLQLPLPFVVSMDNRDLAGYRETTLFGEENRTVANLPNKYGNYRVRCIFISPFVPRSYGFYSPTDPIRLNSEMILPDCSRHVGGFQSPLTRENCDGLLS